jgi:tRNA A-37 threonylcarbamoyl transferase component Bud32
MIQRDNQIYLPGGFHAPSVPSNTIEILNADTLEWQDPLIMPEDRAATTPILVGSRLVLAGGFSDTNSFQYWDASNRSLVEFGRLPSVRDYKLGSSYGSKSIFMDYNGFVNIFDHEKKIWEEHEELENLTHSVAVRDISAVDDEIWIWRARNSSEWQQNSLRMIWRYNITSKYLRSYTPPFVPQDSARITRCANGLILFWTTAKIIGALDPTTEQWMNITLAIGSISAVNSVGSTLFINNLFDLQIYSFEEPSLNTNQTLFDGQTAYVTSFALQDKVVYIVQTGEWIIFDSSLTKSVQAPEPLGSTVKAKFMWKEGMQLIAGLSSVFTYFSTNDTIRSTSTSGLGTGNIQGVFKHKDNIAVVKSDAILFYNQQLELLDNIPRTATASTPIALIGDDIIYVGGCSVLLNFTQDVACSFSGEYSVADNGVAFAFKGSNLLNTDLNIYDFNTKNWSKVIPPASFSNFLGSLYSYGVPNNESIWFYFSGHPTELLSFNIVNETWNNISLIAPVVGSALRGSIFPVIDGLMYLPILNISFLTVNVNTFEQKITPGKDQALRGTRIQQIVSNYKDIVALSLDLALSVEYYNITSETWSSFEVGQHERHSLAFFGDALILRGNSVEGQDTMAILDFQDQLQPVTVLPNFVFIYDLASISTNNVTLFAGGRTPSSLSSRIVDVFYVLDPEAPQVASPDSSVPPGPAVDLVAAIVAPVICGVALIVGGLLAFFLIRRKKQRKAKKSATTVGLESLRGSNFFTPYSEIQFGEILGSGASGQVFIGKWKGTKVALKMSMTQATDALIREIRLMIELRPHPNIVQILGYTVHPETQNIILILEYCDGGSLDTVLFDQQTSPPMSQKVAWIKSITNGVLHLHANNIVHRDLAARNILLSHNEAKITDFGMSRLVGSETGKGTTTSELGPIRWMAPEAIRSKEYSTKSDVWSLGVLVYEILTESEPHASLDPIEVGRQIRDTALTPALPTEHRIPQLLVDVMMSCWAMDPSQRCDVEQICEQLNRV